MDSETFMAYLRRESGLELPLDTRSMAPVTACIARESLHGLCRTLKERFSFEVLMSQTATHSGEELHLYYHFFSMAKRFSFALKCVVPVADPKVPTLTDLWESANWLERETYDLLGVIFEGHPNLKRIMLPDNWEGHPLRKDYQKPTSFMGIDNSATEMKVLER